MLSPIQSLDLALFYFGIKMKKIKESAWQQLSSKLIYDNPWIRVNHDEVKRPNDSEGIYGVVHFKNHAVGIIPIDGEDNTWLVKQSRYVLNESTWEIPEGGAPLAEDPLTAAKRELEEETGLVAKHWRELISVHLSNSVTDEMGTVYVATELSQGQQALEETEDIEIKKIPIDEAIQWVLNGKITDVLSVTGLLRIALERKT